MEKKFVVAEPMFADGGLIRFCCLETDTHVQIFDRLNLSTKMEPNMETTIAYFARLFEKVPNWEIENYMLYDDALYDAYIGKPFQ